MNSLEEISPRLQLKISKRAKRLALRLDTKARLMHLVVPPRASLRKAYEFAWQHKGWILEKLSTLPEPVTFTDGTIIPLLGNNVTIKISYNPNAKTTNITLDNNELLVITNKEDPSSRITRFLKNTAKQEIIKLATEKTSLTGKTVREIQVRDTRSRWGSCSPDGKLSFSWRLIFAPYESLDYLVAHEVAHLTHMDHSKQFWELCTEISANYYKGKRWIRQNGDTLMRYG